jgi:hypothetical protein
MSSHLPDAMKSIRSSIVSVLLATCVAAAPSAAGESYVWTNHAGRSIRAEFVSVDDAFLVIRMNGAIQRTPLAGLSPESVRLAAEIDRRAGGNALGKSVVAFCRSNLWQKVGDGQCASLAVEALKVAGAAGMGRDHPGRGDYVWGKHVATIEATRRGVDGMPSLAEVKPGDIIQFRGVRLAGRSANGGTYRMNADHHTAVVEHADAATGEIAVLHQNWGRKVVRRDTLRLADLKSGWLRIYRTVSR